MYEYTTVRLPGLLTTAAERDWPELLNVKAAQGWRLIAVDERVAYFERTVT
jgi:hypothetical protein